MATKALRTFIRCDASSRMGTGHVMRCLALAVGLREKGFEPVFLCRDHEGNLVDRIRAWGFPVHVLPVGTPSASGDPALPAHASWLGASWREDAESVAGIIRAQEGRAVGLIVDHYGLDALWESRLRPLVGWIAAIDDLADRPHDCDVLLDQNFHEEPGPRYAGLVPEGCRMLLGPDHALLREEFARARAGLKRDPWAGLRRALVWFGGADRGDNIAKALKGFSLAGWEEKQVDVVMPASHPGRQEAERLCAGKSRWTLHADVASMSELMARADLAIGAGGVASWERCCLGLPCLAVCLADNQEELLRNLHRKGALIELGRDVEVTEAAWAEALRGLEADPGKLETLSKTAYALADGGGVARSASILSGLLSDIDSGSHGPDSVPPLSLRRASPSDAMRYFVWANDEVTRRNAFHPEAIGWPAHCAWFHSKLRNSGSYLYVLEERNRPIGQIRFDHTPQGAEISFSIAEGYRGRGLGRRLLEMGAEKIRSESTGPLLLIGWVKQNNPASAGAFRATGFEEADRQVVLGSPCLMFRKAV